MDCFSVKHPEAKEWQVGHSIICHVALIHVAYRRSFHDFHFYELQVKEIYYVGGFGGLNYIGWIPRELYQGSGDIKQDTHFRLQY